ncbi:hypothetical protein GYY70_00775, partial [Snodgrassella sp. ESL0324]
MANEDRLKVKITKSGYQAAIDNSRDANGFKIKISKADVYDDKNNLRGTFDVVGKNIGQQQILLRITVVDKTTSYGIKTIKLIDKYSGVEFAIISHPAGEMIDYINPHKIAYISCNLIITSMDDHTVTIIDSSTADADRDMIDGQVAAIWEAIEHLPGVNLPGNQDTSGNAATASKLLEGRNIGGVFFDGTKDIDLPGVNTKGNQDTTGNASTATYAGQIAARKIGGVIFNAKTDIDLPGVNIMGNQNTSGNAATASKLSIARQIGGVPFDGSQDIHLPVSGGYIPTEQYEAGDLVKVDGEWYECYHPDGCKGKDPRNSVYRPSGWQNADQTKPYYWLKIGRWLSFPETGSPIYLPATTIREGLI